jgi:hypothetical protein
LGSPGAPHRSSKGQKAPKIIKMFLIMGNNRLYIGKTTRSKWFKPKIAWNRLIPFRTTHKNQQMLVWGPQVPLMGLQKATKPQN